MRIAIISIIVAIALGGCAHDPDAITTCCEDHWYGSRSIEFKSEKEFQAHLQRERAKALRIAGELPFNYRACAVQVLSQHLSGELMPEDSAYVGIFGADPDAATLSRFRTIHTKTFAHSELPKQSDNVTSTQNWQYNLDRMQKHRGYGYEAFVSYYCGTLCAGETRYILEREGDSCKITSSGPYGPTA